MNGAILAVGTDPRLFLQTKVTNKYLLSRSRDFGCRHANKVHNEASGIAQAFGLAENFVENNSICMILDDSIFKTFVQDYNLHDSRYAIDHHVDPLGTGLGAADRLPVGLNVHRGMIPPSGYYGQAD